jgi:hypothetical protein
LGSYALNYSIFNNFIRLCFYAIVDNILIIS